MGIISWKSTDISSQVALYWYLQNQPFVPFDIRVDLELQSESRMKINVEFLPTADKAGFSLLSFTAPKEGSEYHHLPLIFLQEVLDRKTTEHLIDTIAKVMAIFECKADMAFVALLLGSYIETIPHQFAHTEYKNLNQYAKGDYKILSKKFKPKVIYESDLLTDMQMHSKEMDAKESDKDRSIFKAKELLELMDRWLNKQVGYLAAGYPGSVSLLQGSLGCWRIPETFRIIPERLGVRIEEKYSDYVSELKGLIVNPQEPMGSDKPISFPVPPGTHWEDINFHFLSYYDVLIQVGSKTQDFKIEDIGLVDKRSRIGKPNLRCYMLMMFANPLEFNRWYNKKYPLDDKRPAARKQMKDLRDWLKNFFNKRDNPIHRWSKKHGWLPKFTVKCSYLSKPR